MNTKKSVLILVVTLLALTMLAGAASAQPLSGSDVSRNGGTVPTTGTAVYIIKFAEPAVASYTGGVTGLDATSPQVTGARKLDVDSPASVAYHRYLSGKMDAFVGAVESALGRQVTVVHRYLYAYNGMAVVLTAQEAARVAGMAGVTNIHAEKFHEPTTDVGPQWIGADAIWDGDTTGSVATKGESVIVGVLDTGINAAHPSFADIGGDGYNHTNPFGAGTYVGVCNPSEPDYDPTFICNDKLIGAWDEVQDPTNDPGAPEDSAGHGSHTASTAAGNVVLSTLVAPTASISATISGVAPHANIIMYDVCVATCPENALLAAADQAIADGVDVINYSISGSDDPWNDSMELAFLDDFNAGIFVSASAGNAGPGASTTAHTSPWVMSVGASTHNRLLREYLQDMSGGGITPPADMTGAGFTSGYGPATIVYAGDYPSGSTATPELCGVGSQLSFISPWPAGTFNGEIVVCDRGTYGRVEKGANVLFSGAGGYVLADNGGGLVADPHMLPAVHVTQSDGVTLKAWLASPGETSFCAFLPLITNETGATNAASSAPTSFCYPTGGDHVATISGTTVDYSAENGDIMAGFSSRGPSLYDIISPNVTAPGVDIWAAYCNGCTSASPDYTFISGTSMSSPHDAGSAALMVALHPSWNPAQIKSAMMSTAYNGSTVVKEDGVTPADPFDMGSGRLNMAAAGNAAIVLDETGANFLAADPNNSGDPKTLNIASMADGSCAGLCTWTRTVTSVYPTTVDWTASVVEPAGTTMTVTPSSFTLDPGESQVLTIDMDATGAAINTWLFGEVKLTPSVPAAATPSLITLDAATQPSVESNPVAINAPSFGLATNPNAQGGSITPATPRNPEAGAVTITHSSSTTITPGNSVACSGDGGVSTTDNQYPRHFDLDAFGLTTGFDVTDVTFGVEEQSGAAINVTVNLYSWNGVTFTYPNFTLVGTATQSVGNAATGTLVNIPVTGSVPAGEWLVVEIATPDTTGVSSFFIGSNTSAETAPSYLASTSCGLPNPLTTASIGFPGMHVVMSVTGNVPTTGGPAAAHLTVAAQVLPADIDVSPASLSSTQAPDTQEVVPLTISNLGSTDLEWDITEDVGSAPEAGGWSDNFDSYANNTNLHGVGGWKGWDNTPGATGFVRDDQSLSSPHSVEIMTTSDLVHEYAGYTSGAWSYTAWQYIPSTFSGTTYYLLLNEYNDGGPYNWSVQLNFNSGTGLVTNDGVSGGSMPYLEDQWVEIRVEIDLDNNLQFLYYNGTLLYSGTWTEEQAGGGQLEIQAVDLYANGASAVYYDDISLAASVSLCSAANDIPWASVDPTSGTTLPGNSDQVDVTFDSTGLTNGSYTGNLCVNSNDPDEGLVVVPLTLNVSSTGTPVTITHSSSQTITPGNSVACSGDGGTTTTDNQYLRHFDLDAFSLTSGLDVTDIEFGVEQVNLAALNVTVNLYSWNGVTFTYANLTLIGTATQSVGTGASGTVVSFPVTGSVAAGDWLVVEIATPDTTGVSGFFIGSNTASETAASYLASVSCGLANPLTFASIGFPGTHIVINVLGIDPALNGAPVRLTLDGYSTVAGDSTTVDAPLCSAGSAGLCYGRK